jgi:putative transposase
MATISSSLEHIKAHLNQVVPDELIVQICRELQHKWRDRVLGPAVTVHLFLFQLLAKMAMQGLRHVAGITVTAQAMCKAKKRLPLQLLMKLVERSVPGGPPQSLWHGLELYLVDGTSFLTADTPELVRSFGKASNQHGTSSGYPVPKLLALMDLSGLIRRVIPLPAARQEYTCLSRLFAAVGLNGLLLGDRGLVSFVHLAMLIQANLQGCFRLPRDRVTFGRGKASRRRVKSLGKQDMLVRWTATQRPQWLSRQRWEPFEKQELLLRQIAYRVHRKGFRPHWAWIITTLLDPQKYPANELIELYNKRWQIEVCFRDLKQTLGMNIISARSAVGVRKEILAFVLLYNLVRAVMQQAAIRQQTTADRISFVDALRWLLWCTPGDPIAELKVNPVRKRPSPPRKIKRGRHRFPQLNGSRAEQIKPACDIKL